MQMGTWSTLYLPSPIYVHTCLYSRVRANQQRPCRKYVIEVRSDEYLTGEKKRLNCRKHNRGLLRWRWDK